MILIEFNISEKFFTFFEHFLMKIILRQEQIDSPKFLEWLAL